MESAPSGQPAKRLCLVPVKTETSVQPERHVCIIDSLRSSNFSSWAEDTQRKVIETGRPTPELDLTTCHLARNNSFMRRFSSSSYAACPWLTACPGENKLFCWPCLLFSPNSSTFSKKGFDDLNHFTQSVRTHERLAAHIDSFLTLKLFNRNSSLPTPDEGRDIHNDLVRKKRLILDSLVDVVCHVSETTKLFPPEETINQSLCRRSLELSKFLGTRDLFFNEHYEGLSSEKNFAYLLESAADILLSELKREINQSRYVSLMLDVTSASRMSTVVRYVKDGEPQEHFVGFSKIPRDLDELLEYLTELSADLSIKDKLVAVAVDGSVVKSFELLTFDNKVSRAFPRALVTHYYAHNLHALLRQSFCAMSKPRTLFCFVDKLADFCDSNSAKLNYFAEENSVKTIPSKWAGGKATENVCEHCKLLVKFCKNIMKNEEEWSPEELIKVNGFVGLLTDFTYIFLLEVLADIFSSVAPDGLNGTDGYMLQGSLELSRLLTQPEEVFKKLWAKACEKYGRVPVTSGPKGQESMQAHKILFYEVTAVLSAQLKARMECQRKITFAEQLISYPEISSDWEEKVTRIAGLDVENIKADLAVLLSRRGKDFQATTVEELAAFVHTKGLRDVFKSTWHLLELVLTLPHRSADRSLAALRRVASFDTGQPSQEPTGPLDLLVVESSFLASLRKRPYFKDLVVQKFIQKHSEPDLFVYK